MFKGKWINCLDQQSPIIFVNDHSIFSETLYKDTNIEKNTLTTTTITTPSQSSSSILSDYIAQLESIFKEFLKTSEENIFFYFKEILGVLWLFTVNCVQNDPIVPRNLHKILQKESKMDLFSLQTTSNCSKLRNEKVFFMQYFLEICVFLLQNGSFSSENIDAFTLLLSSIFGKKYSFMVLTKLSLCVFYSF